MILYHGTDGRAAVSIIRDGLRVSTSGFGQTHLIGAALQESMQEAGRYVGDRSSRPVVLAFEYQPERVLTIEPDAWSAYRAKHMKALRELSEAAWQLAVADDLYWTKHMQLCGWECVGIPSTLYVNGGREWIVFDPKKLVCLGIV